MMFFTFHYKTGVIYMISLFQFCGTLSKAEDLSYVFLIHAIVNFNK